MISNSTDTLVRKEAKESITFLAKPVYENEFVGTHLLQARLGS